ncbi:erythromycin resistance leader peptide [Ferdinandcohnia sp. SAFN-114]
MTHYMRLRFPSLNQ